MSSRHSILSVRFSSLPFRLEVFCGSALEFHGHIFFLEVHIID